MIAILGIDPGPTQSAIMRLVDGVPNWFCKLPNERILQDLPEARVDTVVIEQIESMGMAVGAEVFETVFWSGRFAQACVSEWDRITRRQVKLHLCGSMRAKDKNIRQALIDKFGGSAAIGKKANPGPLFGISGDCWSALAVAVTYSETMAGVPQ